MSSINGLSVLSHNENSISINNEIKDQQENKLNLAAELSNNNNNNQSWKLTEANTFEGSLNPKHDSSWALIQHKEGVKTIEKKNSNDGLKPTSINVENYRVIVILKLKALSQILSIVLKIPKSLLPKIHCIVEIRFPQKMQRANALQIYIMNLLQVFLIQKMMKIIKEMKLCFKDVQSWIPRRKQENIFQEKEKQRVKLY